MAARRVDLFFCGPIPEQEMDNNGERVVFSQDMQIF